MTSHRILFGLLSPSLGGHTRTALAIANVLRDRGYTVDFLVRAAGRSSTGDPQSPPDSLIRAAGFKVVRVSGLYSWNPRSPFRRQLHALVSREPYAAIHWFEFHDGVRDAALVAKAAGCAFLWTVTSGGVPVTYHGLNRVVVFTPEVARDVRRRSPGTAVHLLPARIDFEGQTAQARERARADVRQRLALADTDLLVVRVARCASVYLRSVTLGIALVRRLNRDGQAAAFLHAGYSQDPAVAAAIRRLVAETNAEAGRTMAFSITDDVESGMPYVAAADVCIGSGRTAIEAIGLERPTFVAWGARYLGLVDAGNIHGMADTNFQGRHSETVASDEDVVIDMADALSRRRANREAADSTQSACGAFVRDRYSVQGAVDAYERLYADRTVVVESAFRTFARPGYVAREIFYRLPTSLRQSGIIRALGHPRSPAQRLDANI